VTVKSSDCVNMETLNGLAGNAGVAVREPRIRSGSGNNNVLQGSFMLARYDSGMMIHTCDSTELADVDSEFELPPGIGVTAILNGELEFFANGERHYFDVRDSRTPQCFALFGNQPRTLKRCVRQGRYLRKINVSVDSSWLERYIGNDALLIDQTSNLLKGPTNLVSWQASRRLIALAEQILNPSYPTALQQSLLIESRALEILADSLSRLTDQQDNCPNQRALNRARDYIEANLSTIAGIGEVACHSGMSVSTLQRQFKRQYKRTVADYIRHRRMEWVRKGLEREEMSIGEAAYLAGYNHTSNFVTAYRRHFGTTPGRS